MLVTEWESKYIYFSKQELEKALGVDLNTLPVRKLPLKQNEIISDRLLKPDNNQQNEITRLKAENTLLKAKISELEAAQAQPPQAVENIEQYNNRERNTHLQIIGGLVEQLAKTGSKFRKKDNPNYYAIADTIADVTADYEDAVKAETIRKRLAEAYNTFTTEN